MKAHSPILPASRHFRKDYVALRREEQQRAQRRVLHTTAVGFAVGIALTATASLAWVQKQSAPEQEHSAAVVQNTTQTPLVSVTSVAAEPDSSVPVPDPILTSPSKGKPKSSTTTNSNPPKEKNWFGADTSRVGLSVAPQQEARLAPYPTTNAPTSIYAFHRATPHYQPKPALEHRFLKDARAQEAVVDFIGEHFDVDDAKARVIVASVVQQSEKYKIDPLLLLGLIAQESSFKPSAQSGYGAQGLTQVVPRWHQEKMRQVGIAANDLRKVSIPKQVELGAKVLGQYLEPTGKVDVALQHYNRGPNASSDPKLKYARGVLSYRTKFTNVVHEFTKSAPAPVPALLHSSTTSVKEPAWQSSPTSQEPT